MTLEPKSASSWEEMYRCNMCGALSKHRHEISPCWRCGERSWNEWVCRKLNYGFFAKLFNRFKAEPLETPYYEWKNDDNGKQPQLPRKGHDKETAATIRSLLDLQTEVIDHLPAGFSVDIKHGHIVVTRK